MNILFRSLQQEKLSKEISVFSNLVNKRDFLGEGNKRSNTLAVIWWVLVRQRLQSCLKGEGFYVIVCVRACVCVCVCEREREREREIWPIINSSHPVLRIFDLRKTFRKRQYLLT